MGCGGGCGGSRTRKTFTNRASGIKSRAGKLPWAHVIRDAEGNVKARTGYLNKEQAERAARRLGGKAEENK